MDNTIDKIKERVDIAGFISEYVKIQKAGANFKACCPFHNEKTPSFYISPERQIWHCFGCGLGGSIFDFVMNMEGVEFSEALRILANRAGVELSGYNPETASERVRLLQILSRSARFFEKQLWESDTGRRSLAYLRERGLNDESIKNFRLGFAPDSWDSLIDFLKNSGHGIADIVKAGLAIKKESGGHYDRFRSRIMFPITDGNGDIVGFSGRVFESSSSTSSGQATPAKYINTPQTALYDKSRVLYGLDKAKQSIKKADRCLVVEGNMDVVMSHQAGVANCVASSGTALASPQIRIIKRFTKNVDICFDADAAGLAATERGVALALADGLSVGIVAIEDPECKDPADYVKKHGAKWSEQAGKRKPIVDFYVTEAMKRFDVSTAEGKSKMAGKLLPVIKSISSGIEQSHWLSELSAILKIQEADIRREMQKVPALASLAAADMPLQKETENLIAPNILDAAPANVIEDYAISLILKRPSWYKENCERIDTSIFSETARFLLQKLKEHLSAKAPQGASGDVNKESSADLSKFLDGFEGEQKNAIEVLYLQSQAQWMDLDPASFEEEFFKLIHHLKRRSVSTRLAELEHEIRMAERQQDNTRLVSLMKDFSELSSNIRESI